MHISTNNATTTTSAEIIKPWIIGRIPDFFMLEKEVFKPMAAKALTMRNLLTVFVPDTTAVGIENMLATIDIARKPRINQGNIFAILKFAFNARPSLLCARASFFFKRSCINAKVTTVGMMASVLVSFTIVAKSPAASEKAYPVATTEEVSLTAVPAHIPKAWSVIPSALPIMGKSKIIAMSNKKVADIAYATSLSSASMVGAMAAIAEPPQMPVPAEIRLDSFQFKPNAFPTRYPPPKQVSRVNIITISDILPTVNIVVIFKDKPSKIIANFKIFFEVNLIPGARIFVFPKK